MKKLSLLLGMLISLSFLPLTAYAGHWEVKCYKPCYKCKKVCYKKWVRDRGYYKDYYRKHWHDHHHDHHRHYHR